MEYVPLDVKRNMYVNDSHAWAHSLSMVLFSEDTLDGNEFDDDAFK